MKKLLVLVLTMVMATSAFAVIDSDPNSVGIYFDLTADTVQLGNVAPNSQVPVYFILTNPDFAELNGFELSYTVEGGSYFALSHVFENPQALNIGDPVAGVFIVGYGVPTMTTEATLLMTATILYLGGDPLVFTLSGTEPSSMGNPLLPGLLGANSVIYLGGDSTDIGNINAAMGMGDIGTLPEPVATEAASFDSVKSLYR
jgi:hypothetical protein|nr:hypothetical protein [Candidatus Krumholzibacteria bacterium]